MRGKSHDVIAPVLATLLCNVHLILSDGLYGLITFVSPDHGITSVSLKYRKWRFHLLTTVCHVSHRSNILRTGNSCPKGDEEEPGSHLYHLNSPIEMYANASALHRYLLESRTVMLSMSVDVFVNHYNPV